MSAHSAWRRQVWRLFLLLFFAALSLQVFFAARIALMAVLAPESTSFQRSEAWRLAVEQQRITWSQSWVDYGAISASLKRAVIASEDAGFSEHGGIDWDSIDKARERNQKAQARAQRLSLRQPGREVTPRLRGGSTISQQLAKNLFLSGERTILRKAQELVITLMIEALLPKQRILEIYLNNVEWGEGLFGAQAAARHYFRVDATRLGPEAAARLAVMLPAPKRFEKQAGSAYVLGRAATIVARMAAVDVP